MISLYSGTPGSGKSLHMARDIIDWLNMKHKNVIANFPINEDILSKGFFGHFSKKGSFTYISNSEMSVSKLIEYSKANHIQGKERQTLLCLDECQTFFNPREFARKDRLEWNNFFSQHRKLGYEIILVTQTDRLLDRQIRALVEYEVKHRKINNFKFGKLCPLPTFCSVYYWYGVRERLGCEFFVYRKRLGELYDSYKMFDNTVKCVDSESDV